MEVEVTRERELNGRLPARMKYRFFWDDSNCKFSHLNIIYQYEERSGIYQTFYSEKEVDTDDVSKEIVKDAVVGLGAMADDLVGRSSLSGESVENGGDRG